VKRYRDRGTAQNRFMKVTDRIEPKKKSADVEENRYFADRVVGLDTGREGEGGIV
jgi:hypothetical protein